MSDSLTDSVIDNTTAQRFELAVGDQTAFAEYDRVGDTLRITYVYAPESLRGTGAASRLMQGVSAIVGIKGQKVVPVCGYAVAWFKRNPQFQNLLKQ
jgi:uncharacterized protein